MPLPPLSPHLDRGVVSWDALYKDFLRPSSFKEGWWLSFKRNVP